MSRTDALLPVNRNRTRLGIGEEFSLFILNPCPGQIGGQWQITNAGTEAEIISSSNGVAEFKAGFKPGFFRIEFTLTGPGMSGECSSCPNPIGIEYTGEAPTGVFYEKNMAEDPATASLNAIHMKHRPSAGFYANMYIMPNDVNFYKIKIKESGPAETPKDCGGIYWDGLQAYCLDHQPNPFYLPATSVVVPGKGTLFTGVDKIGSFWFCNEGSPAVPIAETWDATLPGYKQYDITLYYEYIDPNTGASANVPFCKAIQRAENAAGNIATNNPAFSMKKMIEGATTGEVQVITNLLDITTPLFPGMTLSPCE